MRPAEHLGIDMKALCFEKNEQLDSYRIYTGGNGDNMPCYGREYWKMQV